MIYKNKKNITISKTKCFFIIIIFLIISIFSTGCSQQEYINNKETGEIDSGQKSELQDGTYSMVSTYFDHYGYKQKLEISVISGLITKVTFSEVDFSGNPKPNQSEWPKKQTGMDLSAIYQQFSSQMIERQNSKIDTITGATKTTSDFSILAESFLEKAKNGKSGDHEVSIGDDYHAEINNVDLISSMDISFDNKNNITKVTFSETINGIPRSSNAEYKQLYSKMCEQTILANNLSPLTPDSSYSQEYEHYNTLLNMISNLRKGI